MMTGIKIIFFSLSMPIISAGINIGRLKQLSLPGFGNECGDCFFDNRDADGAFARQRDVVNLGNKFAGKLERAQHVCQHVADNFR